MTKTDREKEYDRMVATGEIVFIDGVPVRVPKGDPVAAERQRKAIRKQLTGMLKSGDPWKIKKAEKWAWVARKRKRNPQPFWMRALADINPDGNVYRALMSKTAEGWIGTMAEFPCVLATGKTLKITLKLLASELKAHLKTLDAMCDANQKVDGLIVGVRPDGRTAVWIGRRPSDKDVRQTKARRSRPAKDPRGKI